MAPRVRGVEREAVAVRLCAGSGSQDKVAVLSVVWLRPEHFHTSSAFFWFPLPTKGGWTLSARAPSSLAFLWRF